MVNKIRVEMRALLIIFVIILASCSNKIDYYHGYVYNTENEPIKNLKIEEDDDLKSHSYTDENGYFKILEKNSFGGNLIVYNENNVVLDTIRIVYSNHGEQLNYQFIDGRSDTLFLKMKDKIVLPQTNN